MRDRKKFILALNLNYLFGFELLYLVESEQAKKGRRNHLKLFDLSFWTEKGFLQAETDFYKLIFEISVFCDLHNLIFQQIGRLADWSDLPGR